jgi:hypothetical protein
VRRFIFVLTFVALVAVTVNAQQSAEQRVALNEAATGFDSRSTPAIEGKLLTTALNGSTDSPVTNVRLVVRNLTSNAFTYVSGWATFYDASAVRCGEGLFKIDALAPGESSETDTPGLRLTCTPASWRIVASSLMMRSVEVPKEVVAAAPPEPIERRPVSNYVLSINGEDHPIQVGNPVVVKMGSKKVKIVLREAGH